MKARIKNKKGFTLIELLAVIVILGLLMAIAIPSVTKFITQSRKKTITTTIGNYIGALTNQVNDMEYIFTASNTVYAVPIECIALERGGTNPFGEWMQASNSYWAYVLVQYDDATSSYTYGFTFKDSAGYGLFPTTSEKLNESGKQIQQDLDLKKPTNGTITNITAKANWTGFDIEDDTNLVVLEAASEGETGDGKTTCTLCQKGDNYDEVEKVKEEVAINDRTLMTTTSSSTKAFWNYREKIKNITFEESINIPDDAYESWDVSSTGNGKVMAYITKNATYSSYYDLYIQGDGKIYANPNSSYLFNNFKNLDNINNMSVLNTSKVTNMSYMFAQTGYSSKVITLDLGNKFDTSKVTNMMYMFYETGYSSNVFTLGLGDKFDTSKVYNMIGMFRGTGYKSSKFTLDLGDKFDTSNVTNMSQMFYIVGYNSTVFTLDLGDKFDTSKVTNMYGMFTNIGQSSTKFTLDLGDKFDTSRVTNMYGMFNGAGRDSTVFTLDLGDKFDTSKVTDMSLMFNGTGESSTIFTLDLGDKFDTSNVTYMYGMFSWTGHDSTVFTLDLGDKFDTSKVTNMKQMFNSAGQSNTKFTLDLGDKFNTSNVTDMSNMFSYTGYKSSKFKLDCRSWNVDKVTSYSNFNTGVTTKVTAPIWKK